MIKLKNLVPVLVTKSVEYRLPCGRLGAQFLVKSANPQNLVAIATLCWLM